MKFRFGLNNYKQLTGQCFGVAHLAPQPDVGSALHEQFLGAVDPGLHVWGGI